MRTRLILVALLIALPFTSGCWRWRHCRGHFFQNRCNPCEHVAPCDDCSAFYGPPSIAAPPVVVEQPAGSAAMPTVPFRTVTPTGTPIGSSSAAR